MGHRAAKWIQILLMTALICTGCAHKGRVSDAEKPTGQEMQTAEDEAVPEPAPLGAWNMVMFQFNDTLYFGVIKPIAQAFRALLPVKIRQGIANAFHNVKTPVRMVNCMLQAKGAAAQAEFVRFCMNTTVGVLGFGNPAGKIKHLNPPEEDLGQTLGVWGFGEGVVIVWPVLGFSTIRDTVGMADRFLDPTTYIEPTEASIAVSVLDRVNAVSFRIGDYEAIKAAALEPYDAFRDAYIQYRRKKIRE